MGLFNSNSDKSQSKSNISSCYGETESTTKMQQFIMFYRINTGSFANAKKQEGFFYEVINDDLYSKGLIPVSIKQVDSLLSGSDRSFQVVVKRV